MEITLQRISYFKFGPISTHPHLENSFSLLLADKLSSSKSEFETFYYSVFFKKEHIKESGNYG